MGKLVKRTTTQIVLEMSHEDIKKRKERELRRFRSRVDPKLLPWQERFTEKLMKCPYCGKAPGLNRVWHPLWGFEYKFSCSSVKNHRLDMGCGDWYESLSRAGLSWNYRVQEARGCPRRVVRHHALTQTERETNNGARK